jgi:anti-sigma-K factor RskA
MLVLRDNFIAKSGDLIRSKWESPTPKQPAAPEQIPAQELGEVVWSSSAQQGFMTIRGLPVNDILKEQYQLWIIDPTRDEKPVDGGVFDITNATESIIPIRAKLQVDKPTLFAITIEKPGGVVVSDQKRLPLLAKVIQ